MKNLFFYTGLSLAIAFSLPASILAQTSVKPVIKVAAEASPLKLPANFKSVVLAENVGRPRHIVVTPQGGIYVKLAKPVNNKGTLFLTESNSPPKV